MTHYIERPKYSTDGGKTWRDYEEFKRNSRMEVDGMSMPPDVEPLRADDKRWTDKQIISTAIWSAVVGFAFALVLIGGIALLAVWLV